MARLIKIPDDGIIRIPIIRGESTIGEQRIDLSDFPNADAVEVVRCKDCRGINHPISRKEGRLLCERIFRWVSPDDFCSIGERRTDD